MVAVSKEEFFAYVGPRDIVIRNERMENFWETRNRVIVGRSTPGYLAEGEKAYFLTEEAHAALKAKG